MIRIGPLRRPENRHYLQFKQLFNRSLADYWDVTGFKLIEFDHDIGTPRGVSCEDHIRANYGQPAVDLIYVLLGDEEKGESNAA